MTTTTLPDRVYGDWEWDEQTNRPGNIYPARVVSWWSGGCEFLTDKATLERIVEVQTKLRGEMDYPEDLAQMRWEGDVMVITEVDGTEFTYGANDEGLYPCGFGWTWGQWTDENEAEHPDPDDCEEDGVSSDPNDTVREYAPDAVRRAAGSFAGSEGVGWKVRDDDAFDVWAGDRTCVIERDGTIREGGA